MKAITTLFLGTSIVAMAFVTHKEVSVRHTPMDTLPKYRYFILLNNPNQYVLSEDSVKMVLQGIGRSMSADVADQWQKFAAKHLSLMMQSHVRDSVLIEAKPIVKPIAK